MQAPDAGHPSGFLNVYKSVDWTSNDIVRALKRRLKLRKVGHGGTLDPQAEGVLPICIGSATRLAGNLLHGTKEYRMTVELGRATDTLDYSGKTVAERPYNHVTRAGVERWLLKMTGQIEQVPPAFSALKHEGQRMYKLARAGITVQRAPRAVDVMEAQLLEFNLPQVMIEVTCGSGFYARSYAADLGQGLDSAAHLAELVRTRSGVFELKDAVSMETLNSLTDDERWKGKLLPPEYVIQDYPRVDVGMELQQDVQNGIAVPPSALPSVTPAEDALIRVHGTEGQLIAVLKYNPQKGAWHPGKVFVRS